MCCGGGQVWDVSDHFRLAQAGTIQPVAPVAYRVILEPGIGQFREFEPRRVHTRLNSLGLLCTNRLAESARA